MDFLMTSIGIPLDITAAAKYGWWLGEELCIFLGFVMTMSGKLLFSVTFPHNWIDNMPFFCLKIADFGLRWGYFSLALSKRKTKNSSKKFMNATDEHYNSIKGWQ